MELFISSQTGLFTDTEFLPSEQMLGINLLSLMGLYKIIFSKTLDSHFLFFELTRGLQTALDLYANPDLTEAVSCTTQTLTFPCSTTLKPQLYHFIIHENQKKGLVASRGVFECYLNLNVISI